MTPDLRCELFIFAAAGSAGLLRTRSSRLTSFVPPCCTLLSDIAELSAAEEKASSGVDLRCELFIFAAAGSAGLLRLSDMQWLYRLLSVVDEQGLSSSPGGQMEIDTPIHSFVETDLLRSALLYTPLRHRSSSSSNARG
jgi:hypothetical protein